MADVSAIFGVLLIFGIAFPGLLRQPSTPGISHPCALSAWENCPNAP